MELSDWLSCIVFRMLSWFLAQELAVVMRYFICTHKIAKSDHKLYHVYLSVSPVHPLFVPPSAWNNSVPTGWISWNLIFEYFSKICGEITVFLNYGSYKWRPMHISDDISVLLRMRYIPEKSVRENQNMHFIFTNFILKVFLFITYCGKIRKSQTSHRWRLNMVLSHFMLDNWDYRHTCRICNACCFFTATVVMQKQMSLSVTLRVHCLFCLSWIFLVLARKFWGGTSILTLTTCIDAVMLSCIWVNTVNVLVLIWERLEFNWGLLKNKYICKTFGAKELK